MNLEETYEKKLKELEAKVIQVYILIKGKLKITLFGKLDEN